MHIHIMGTSQQTRIAKALAVIACLLVPFGQARAQGSAEITARLTAEFAERLAATDAMRTRDLEMADDEKRRIRDDADHKAAVIQKQLVSLQTMLRTALSAANRKDKEVASLRTQLTQASASYTQALEQRDAETRETIEVFKASINRSVSQSTPDELSAIQRVIDGDDKAYETLNQIVDAKIAANNAVAAIANAAAEMQIARTEEFRFYKKVAKRIDVIEVWKKVIALDPLEWEPRANLCNFYYSSSDFMLVGPDVTPMEQEGASIENNKICRDLAAPLGGRDKLEIYAVMSRHERYDDAKDRSLETNLYALSIIDELIKQRDVDFKLMNMTVDFTHSAVGEKSEIILNSMRNASLSLPKRERTPRSEMRADALLQSASLYDSSLLRLDLLADQLKLTNSLDYLKLVDQIAAWKRKINLEQGRTVVVAIEKSVNTLLKSDPESLELHYFHATLLAQLLRSPKTFRTDPKQADLITQIVTESRWVLDHTDPSNSDQLRSSREGLAEAVVYLEKLAPEDSSQQLAAYKEELNIHLDILRDNRGRFKSQIEENDLAGVFYDIGLIDVKLGYINDAKISFDSAAQLYAQLRTLQPDDSSYGFLLASSLEQKANALEQLGDLNGAVTALDRANIVLRLLAKSQSDSDYDVQAQGNELIIARLRKLMANGASR